MLTCKKASTLFTDEKFRPWISCKMKKNLGSEQKMNISDKAAGTYALDTWCSLAIAMMLVWSEYAQARIRSLLQRA